MRRPVIADCWRCRLIAAVIVGTCSAIAVIIVSLASARLARRQIT